MGGIYEHGKIVPKDYKVAAEYYRRAAELGYALAKSNLGAVYLEGKGIEKDVDMAYKLFRESCKEDSRWGFAGCYNMLRNVQDVGADEQEYIKAIMGLEQACLDKQGLACEYLGDVYLNGWWVQADPSSSSDFFQRGCVLGISSACGKAGELYFLGLGVEQNKGLAEILLAEACNNDDEESCVKLSVIQRGYIRGSDECRDGIGLSCRALYRVCISDGVGTCRE